MIRRLLIVALVLTTVGTTGCGKKKGHSNRGSSATVASNGSGTLPTFGSLRNLISVTPAAGPLSGGTQVTLDGLAFAPGMTVAFGGTPATNVQVVSEVRITCTTPAHAAGFVDVAVLTNSGGVHGQLPNAFNYDPNLGGGVLARVADHQDTTGEEQEIAELMNKARKDPNAEAARLNAQYGTALNFSGFPPIQPLMPNQFLGEAARGHVTDMATRGFYGHVNPDGVNANGRILATAYDLNTPFFGDNPTINLTENIGKGTGAAPGNQLTTPQGVHDTFLIDANVTGAKHRVQMLGGNGFQTRRELGLGYLHQAPSDYIDEEFAFTNVDKPLVHGVVYNDTVADGICRNGEGRSGVTVTLSHSSGFSISTQSKTAGGFGFEIFVPGTYTLTIDGVSTQVVVADKNLKVDLKGTSIVQ